MLSYHNDPKLKEASVAAAKHHRDADMLISGTYSEMNGSFKGCSVGCDFFDIYGYLEEAEYHQATAEYFGFPEWLERLRDSLFENLSDDERVNFHVDFKEAIPVGVDLEPVRHKLAIRRIDRLIERQKANTEYDVAEVVAALTTVRRCHEAEICGNVCDWFAARFAARFAAESAARSAAWSAESAESAESAAWSAAWSAWSAWSAAWSAAESAAWSAERSAARFAAESAARSAAWSAARFAAESAARSAARFAAESAAWKQERDDLLDILGAMQ